MLLKFYPDKDAVTPAILSLVILVTALLQWYTELKAESAMEALRGLQVVEPVSAVRARTSVNLEPEELVVGDIIYLKAGQRVPADVRILHCSNMEVDNSALTGETLPEMRSHKAEPPSMPATEAGSLRSRPVSLQSLGREASDLTLRLDAWLSSELQFSRALRPALSTQPEIKLS